MAQIVAAGATFTSIRCSTETAPGAGKTATFKLNVNNVDTTLECSITGTNTTGSGSGSVTVSAGDLLAIHTGSTNTPTRPGSFAVSG